MRSSRRSQALVLSSDRRVASQSQVDDKFVDNFVPYRRVITCDSDIDSLHLLAPSVSGSSVSLRSVSRVSLCCGASVGEFGARCGVSSEHVGDCVNSEGDLNSWKHEAAGRTKVSSQSSGLRDWCSFVDTVLGRAALAQYLRGAPEGTNVEAWDGSIFTCSRATTWEASVAEGCTVTVPAVYLPKKRPGPPAAGPLYRILFGWSRLLYTASLGIWIFRGAPRGSQVLPALVFCFDWAVRGTYRTAWAVQPCCRCSYSYGSGPAVGPQALGNWELLRGLWKAVAPLMAPWCAEGEVPTCANLNFYGGSGSRVRWHSDNEALFGKQEESKLIVSMSFGVSALFKWKPGPSLDSDASSSWLHRGDLLVMDGCCQYEYLHCSDALQGGERVNITFRWIRNHVVVMLPTHVRKGFTRVFQHGVVPAGSALSCSVGLAGLGFFSFCLPSSHPGLNCVAGPRATTGFFCWVRCGFGGRGSGQNSGSKKLGWFYLDYFVDWLLWMRSMLVWKGLPSLPNNDAYFVFWITGAPRENGRLRDF